MMKKIICLDHFGHEYQISESEFVNREAVYGIYRKNHQILLVKDAKSGYWEIPGGGKIKGQNDAQCLAREFYEETGLETGNNNNYLYKEDLSYFYDLESGEPWKTLRRYYIVTTANGSLLADGNNDDVIQADFIDENDLKNVPMQKPTLSLLSSLPLIIHNPVPETHK